MLREEAENCLPRPASLETGATEREGLDRSCSAARDLWGARVNKLVREEIAACLRTLLAPIDMSPNGNWKGNQRIFIKIWHQDFAT